jgi:hypothetical protein
MFLTWRRREALTVIMVETDPGSAEHSRVFSLLRFTPVVTFLRQLRAESGDSIAIRVDQSRGVSPAPASDVPVSNRR